MHTTTSGRTPLTCREVVELVTDYLDGALPPAERRRFEAHLEDCPDCGAYLGQMRRTVRALGAVRAEDVPRETLVGMCVSFRHWPRGT